MAYQQISESIWDEPEYRTAEEQNTAAYLIAKRDMAGVVPVEAKTTARRLRISPGKLNKILDYFMSIGKVEISIDRTHIWWKSGIFHSLCKGKYSETQLKAVQKLLKKWSFSGKFYSKNGQDFGKRAVQLLENKYSLVIPYPTLARVQTESESESESETKSEAEAKGENPPETPPPSAPVFTPTEVGKIAFKSLYKSKFRSEIADKQINELLQDYITLDLLSFTIARIKNVDSIQRPVGLLFSIAREDKIAAGQFSDADYDEFKKRRRQIQQKIEQARNNNDR